MKRIENFMLPEHMNKLYTNEAISSIALILVDYGNRLIKTVRIGNGSNRTIALTGV